MFPFPHCKRVSSLSACLPAPAPVRSIFADTMRETAEEPARWPHVLIFIPAHACSPWGGSWVLASLPSPAQQGQLLAGAGALALRAAGAACWAARAGGPLVLAWGTAERGRSDGCAGPGPAADSSLVPVLPTGRPQPCWRLGGAGAAATALPRSPLLQPQAQVPLGSAGRGGIWEGLGGAGDCQASRRRVGGSQLSTPGWLPFDPRSPLSCPGTLFLCPPAPPDPRARAPHSWLVPSIPAVRPQKGKATSSERTQKSSRCCRKTARHACPPGSPAPSGSCRKPWKLRREVSPRGLGQEKDIPPGHAEPPTRCVNKLAFKSVFFKALTYRSHRP